MILSRSWPVLLFLLPAVAYGQEAQDIVVTGQGLDAPGSEAVYSLVTIDRDRLTSGSGIESVLKDVAGLQQFRRSDVRSANPTSQGVTLRGLGGNASSRALIMLDGVPQSDPFGGWVSFTAFAPERLAQIRMMRGGGSVASGAGALVGTIELISAGQKDMAGPGGGISFGSRGSVTENLFAPVTLGQGFITIGSNYARGNGFIPIIRQSRGPADRPAPYEQFNIGLRAVVPIGETVELQANMSGFTDDRERGFAFSDINSKGADASIRLVGHGDWGWSALSYIQIRQFQNSFASLDSARTVATPVSNQYNVPSTGYGTRLELRPSLGGKVILRMGADWRRSTGQTKEFYFYDANANPRRGREAGGSSDVLGGYVEASSQVRGSLVLTAALRMDYWNLGRGFLRERNLVGPAITDIRYADRHGWEPTGRMGFKLPLGTGWGLRGAAYMGWRLPTLNELYRPFRVGNDVTTANPSLKPERLHGVELGLDYDAGKSGSFSVTLFSNHIRNAIANVTIGPPGTRQRQNIDAVRANGIELDARRNFGNIYVQASYAFSDSKLRASGISGPLNGLRPAQTPRHMASASANWKADRFSTGLTLRYVAAQFEDDLNRLILKDAVTLDARLSYIIGSRIEVEIRGENLTNTQVDAARTDAGLVERASPRAVMFGIKLRP